MFIEVALAQDDDELMVMLKLSTTISEAANVWSHVYVTHTCSAYVRSGLMNTDVLAASFADCHSIRAFCVMYVAWTSESNVTSNGRILPFCRHSRRHFTTLSSDQTHLPALPLWREYHRAIVLVGSPLTTTFSLRLSLSSKSRLTTACFNAVDKGTRQLTMILA